MYSDPFNTISRLAQRSTSAVVARTGTKSPALRAHLAALMSGIGKPESFLNEPLVEAAHGFVPAEECLQDLAGNLLRADVVDALDGGGAPDPQDRERYRFRREWRPFRHQVEAWRALLDPSPKSVMVTSGTGSGKTECFFVPLLNSLAEQAASGNSLTGVQAIMLYPLNALINSQRERLSDWTAPFKGKIRFALFNGETPNEMPESERQKRPEEVIDRKKLRETPPPILVTNVTMLEYMLVRFEDRPILEQSQGKLRYIVLDEAHTYVGSQAAELSLLLRRVLLAFGVKPQNVRFVATSATIGRHGDPETSAGLRKFLAQVAGVPETQALVIEGTRKAPTLPLVRPDAKLPSAEALGEPDPEELFDRLGSTPDFVRGFAEITRGPISLKRWCEAIGTDNADLGTAVLRAGARAEKGGERLLPLRIHAFHRSQPGAWACLNPSCSGRTGTALEDEIVALWVRPSRTVGPVPALLLADAGGEILQRMRAGLLGGAEEPRQAGARVAVGAAERGGRRRLLLAARRARPTGARSCGRHGRGRRAARPELRPGLTRSTGRSGERVLRLDPTCQPRKRSNS